MLNRRLPLMSLVLASLCVVAPSASSGATTTPTARLTTVTHTATSATATVACADGNGSCTVLLQLVLPARAGHAEVILGTRRVTVGVAHTARATVTLDRSARLVLERRRRLSAVLVASVEVGRHLATIGRARVRLTAPLLRL